MHGILDTHNLQQLSDGDRESLNESITKTDPPKHKNEWNRFPHC